MVGQWMTVEEKPRMGLCVSDQCRAKVAKGKGWFEFRRFVWTFWPLLSSYTLLGSDTTAEILAEIESELKLSGHQPPHQPLWSLETSSNSRRLVNKLVANEKPVERILWFLDPSELEEDLRRLWTLREAAAQHDQKLYINLGARVWAEREWNRRCGVDSGVAIGTNDAIVLLRQVYSRHIDRFALKYLSEVMLFTRFVVTGRTRDSLSDFVKAASKNTRLTGEDYLRLQTVQRLVENSDVFEAESELHLVGWGGRSTQSHETITHVAGRTLERMQDVAEFLRNSYFYDGTGHLEDRLCHVLACPGPHPEQTDTQALEVLIRACADPHMRVNLILNEATAEEWMQPRCGPIDSRL